MKRKKYLKVAISLGIGAILITSAVFANYENAGGYSVCKEALKRVAFAKNFSVDYTLEVTIDKELYDKACGGYKLSADGNPTMQSEMTEISDDRVYYIKETCQDNLMICQTKHSAIPEQTEYTGYINNYHGSPESFAAGMAVNEETGEKLIGFLETLSDTLIGDLKNSFVLTSNEGNVKKYNINLAKEQLPAFVNSGVSLITSSIKNEGYISENEDDNKLYMMFFGNGEPGIKNVSANMSVDEKGNPVQISATVNVSGYDENGAEHILNVNMSYDFYNFGTTEIERVSESEISKLTDYRIEPKEIDAEDVISE